jgi:hypothetical protein
VPGYLLVILVVKSFDDSIRWLTQTDYCEIPCSVEHVVVVGSPFITMNDVLLRLVAFKLFVSRISSIVIFECFSTLGLDVLHNDEPTAVVIPELDRQTWLQLFFLLSTRFTEHFN